MYNIVLPKENDLLYGKNEKSKANKLFCWKTYKSKNSNSHIQGPRHQQIFRNSYNSSDNNRVTPHLSPLNCPQKVSLTINLSTGYKASTRLSKPTWSHRETQHVEIAGSRKRRNWTHWISCHESRCIRVRVILRTSQVCLLCDRKNMQRSGTR